ncbi:hypothetical protein VN23_18360 [Janthinobacterium sp. B9-8]|nr:hypothetical protein VN23_18360 [Janthinobacterium sp. B9-8]
MQKPISSALRHVDFGAGIPRGGLTFLNGQESKQRRPPRPARTPLTADNRLGEKGCSGASPLPLFRNPDPLIPFFGVLQGGFKPRAMRRSKRQIIGFENAQNSKI